MLLQTMIKLAFQASGVLSAQKKEQETDMEKQDVGTKDADDTNDRLKVKWFSEIPHCSFRCLYPPALECGCNHSDFPCICRSIPDIVADEDIEACLKSCPVNPDQRWAPSRILDLCDLVGEPIQLPEFMAQFAHLHRRQDGQASPTDDGVVYLHFSTVSGGEINFSPVSEGESDSGRSEQTATATATMDTQASKIPTTSTRSGTTTSPPTSSITRSASTDTASSSSSGLSTGAKAGIGVAIPLVVIALGLLLFWYFRKRSANRSNGAGNNIPQTNQQSWPKDPSSDLKTLPAEADSTALHEPDSTSVLGSPSPAVGPRNPSLYELSGNSVVEYPPAAALATQKDRNLRGHNSATTSSFMSDNVPRKAVTPPASPPISPISETEPSRGLDDFMGGLTDSGPPSQNPQMNTQEGTERPSSGVGKADVQLSRLEIEMAHVVEERERLQQMQALADKEAELKRQIAARKREIAAQETAR